MFLRERFLYYKLNTGRWEKCQILSYLFSLQIWMHDIAEHGSWPWISRAQLPAHLSPTAPGTQFHSTSSLYWLMLIWLQNKLTRLNGSAENYLLVCCYISEQNCFLALPDSSSSTEKSDSVQRGQQQQNQLLPVAVWSAQVGCPPPQPAFTCPLQAPKEADFLRGRNPVHTILL